MSDHKPKTTHTSPLPLRTLGRRGGVLALALWGSSAFNAAAQDPPVIDPRAPIDTAESPPVDIYGGPPMRDDAPPIKRRPPPSIKKPADAPWEDARTLQGTWINDGGARLRVSGDVYSLTVGSEHELGTLQVYTVPSEEGSLTVPLLLNLTKRRVNGAPAPDLARVYWISRDLTLLTDDSGREFHIDTPLVPVSDYGLPPIPE
jgi:hypothetical protein